MRTGSMRRNATRGEIGLALGLLAGVMVMAYGYFYQSRAGFYVGLMVIAAGLVGSLLRIALRGGR